VLDRSIWLEPTWRRLALNISEFLAARGLFNKLFEFYALYSIAASFVRLLAKQNGP